MIIRDQRSCLTLKPTASADKLFKNLCLFCVRKGTGVTL